MGFGLCLNIESEALCICANLIKSKSMFHLDIRTLVNYGCDVLKIGSIYDRIIYGKCRKITLLQMHSKIGETETEETETEEEV